MKTLSISWLTDELMDFEYKKYMLLGYLKTIQTEFDTKKLYPLFSDLIFHYQNLMEVKNHKQLLHTHFPQRLSRADLQKMELEYQKIVNDDETMAIIEDVMSFALPKFKEILEDGKEIYEFIASNLEINPVGITPFYTDEGYLLVNEFADKAIKVFQYKITVFENQREKLRGLNITHIDTVNKSISQTYENVKVNLVKKYQNLPNPATFAIAAKVPCPFQEALLPVAKRSFVQYITKLSA
jgi:hypothetical protein